MVWLVGREAELVVLHDLVTGAGSGTGGALVLRGPAGIGKSALIEAAQHEAHAKGMTVVAARGVASETLLPFGVLHQLLWPLLRDPRLPETPRQLLRSALGAAGAAAPDLYAIAVATLELLVEAADRNPILVVAEDAHWFDRSSADVLAFVARRAGSAPIALVAAVRGGDDTTPVDALGEAGLPDLPLGPLPEEDARALLDRAATELPAGLRERILTAASGNPLALLELPASVREDSFSTVVPMNARLESAFTARLPEMPGLTRTLLLAAAAEPSCTLAQLLTVVAAVSGEPVGIDVLDPAAAAGLVRSHGLQLRFRHPLVASAVYQAAAPSDRIAMHAALATALADQPDRAIWHRSAAATGPDPEVAADLRVFAGRAALRGAASVAVAALERAASFSAGADRIDLLLRAAELSCETGQARERLPTLLEQIRAGEPTGRDAARRMQVEAVLAPIPDTQAIAGLVEHATMIWEQDRALAYSLLLAAAIRCWWGGAPPELRALVQEAADRFDPDLHNPPSLTVHAYASQPERGALLLDRAGRVLADPDPARRRFAIGVYALTGDFAVSATITPAAIATARGNGQVLLTARWLAVQSGTSFWAGAWDAGLAEATEAERLGRELHDPSIYLLASATQAMFAAARGELDRAEACIAATLADPALPGNRAVLAATQKGRAMVALAAGRPADAMERVLSIYDPADAHHHWMYQYWALTDLAEAARAAGQLDRARAILAALDQVAEPIGSVRIALGVARALLATDDHAEPLFEAALAEDLAAWPFERARLNLAYGRFLRRRLRVTQSRAPLRLAAEILERLGATAWREQARSELRATGAKGTAPRGGPAAMTAQELQIARLAAEGLSNREIGERLFLSPRTVGSHLYRIFPKLGIANRAQLSAVLNGSEG
ncbi:LuxR family transcriptional regulator [Paractinoplanes durhamensis]|uniref:LuxR family transcriptional regulator n=1 Tax=Paractinoplanes durhamensis TaxID=113563 RepID=A0ABQ3Z6Z0_9ACTN|nr:LuxR family transcriptional regulator [Actinoplanes durhamensis]GIE05595.1 LuxR family transcriptional regulator [Actinoplanes durhamensis]